MNEQKSIEISQLLNKYPKEGYGPNLIMYNITLEAWRRGITVKFFTVYVKNQIKIRYYLSNEGKEYRFQLSLGDKVTKEARNIGKSKDLTKEYLVAANVSVPEGKILTVKKDFSKVITYAESLGYPIVIKPAKGSLGRGVITNIKDEETLMNALKYIHDDLGYEDIIVERFITGDDTRVYVAGDTVIAAYKRVPANVVGDGKNNIKELIAAKNKNRKTNPHAGAYEIIINDELTTFIGKQGHSLETILNEEEKVFLTKSTLHPDGCETVDITDELSDKDKKNAINAVKAIPGMNLSGVDIMMDKANDLSYVLELNSRPNIGGHIFPLKGQSRDVPRAIIDYYFPETKSNERGKNDYFTFDFDKIMAFLRQGIVKEVTLPSLPKNDVISIKLLLTGNIQYYKNWIFKAAIGSRLGGEIRELENDKAQLILAGEKERVDVFIKNLFKKKSPKFDVKVISENQWDSLIMYKFESLVEMQNQSTDEYNQKYQNEKKSNGRLIKENEKLKKELVKLRNSKSWKVTGPLRKISKLSKNDKL